jgi:branched-chain amino acid transport system substrate-binding protein
MIRLETAALAIGLAVGLAPHANAQGKYPGVTDSEIKLGQTTPYSGPLSSLAVVSKANLAYFKMINDQGGMNGRKINLISLDDSFTPAKTVEQTRRLAEQDQVAAFFQSMGTPTGAAVQAYLNRQKIPQLFQSTGGDRFNNPAQFPYSSHFSPSYKVEAILYAKYLAREMPDAKVALLYQNDDFGRDYQNGLRIGFGEEAGKAIVGEASFLVPDPNVDSQIVTLHGSGANVLVAAANPRAVPQAVRKAFDIGWKVPVFVPSTTANIAVLAPAGLDKAVGVLGGAFMKDPKDQRWAEDAGTKAYLAWLTKYYPDGDPADTLITYGYNAAALMVHVLKACGDDLSRDNINNVANNLKDVQLPMFQPGITITTTPEDHTIVSQLQIVRFNGQGWDPVGGLVHK